MGPTQQKSFDDLDTNGPFANVSEKGILVLEHCPQCGSFMKNIEINACKIATIFPGVADFTFQVQ